jgi:hypothetical protein
MKRHSARVRPQLGPPASSPDFSFSIFHFSFEKIRDLKKILVYKQKKLFRLKSIRFQKIQISKLFQIENYSNLNNFKFSKCLDLKNLQIRKC